MTGEVQGEDITPFEDNGESLWTQLLKRAMRTTDVKEGNIAVLGDAISDRRVLIEELCQCDQNGTKNPSTRALSSDDSSPGAMPLEASYWELTTDVGVAPKASFWSINSVNQVNLLDFATPSAESLSQLHAMIVVDMANLSTVIPSLEKWIAALGKYAEERAAQLGIDPEILKHNVETAWRRENKGPKNQSDELLDDESIELGEGVLTNNVGVPPIIVALNSHLCVGESVDEEAVDYVQYQIRKLALSVGGGVVYTSVSKGLGVDNLCKFLWYRLMPGEFQMETKPEILNRSTLFVPSGWDSLDLLSTLIKPSLQGMTSEEFFDDAKSDARASFKLPGHENEVNDVEIVDEQEFLAKLLAKQKLMGGMAPQPRASKSTVSTTATGSKDSLESMSTTSPASAAAAKENPAMIANFFHSLLSRDKDSTGAADAAQPTQRVTRSSQRLRNTEKE